MSEGIPHGVCGWMAADHDLQLHGVISLKSLWQLSGASELWDGMPGAPESRQTRWPKKPICFYLNIPRNVSRRSNLHFNFPNHYEWAFFWTIGEEDGSIFLSSFVAAFKSKDSQARQSGCEAGAVEKFLTDLGKCMFRINHMLLSGAQSCGGFFGQSLRFSWHSQPHPGYFPRTHRHRVSLGF